MKKEINEKTFELNITHELLDISKTIFLMMLFDYDFPQLPDRYLKLLFEHMNDTKVYAEGLTQAEEAAGGYDVSINIYHREEARVMFLQFKAGKRTRYSRTPGSIFFNEEHIVFSFNAAADSNQHFLLRDLAAKGNIAPKSVMYVFPRITEKKSFRENLGKLINYSSFVPVEEIDHQAEEKGIIIKQGISHKYRTNYEGTKTEINLLLLLLLSDDSIGSKIIAEFICIHIERFAKILQKEDSALVDILISIISKAPGYFNLGKVDQAGHLQGIRYVDFRRYLDDFLKGYADSKTIQEAPSTYTTKIPKGGLTIGFKDQKEYESLRYQVF